MYICPIQTNKKMETLQNETLKNNSGSTIARISQDNDGGSFYTVTRIINFDQVLLGKDYTTLNGARKCARKHVGND